jgi:hypothetical protein
MSLSTELASQTSGELIEEWRYSPSWFDRFSAWLEGLPGPYPLYYIGLGIGILLILYGSSGFEGNDSGPITNPMRAYIAIIIPYIFGLAHVLDHTAGNAVEKLKQSLRRDGLSPELLKYQITTLPARPALLASLAMVFVIHIPMLFSMDYIGIEPDLGDASQRSFFIVGVIFWWAFGFGAYHTVHQLCVVNRIYTENVDVNLYRSGSLYALSTVTAITSIGILVSISMAIAVVPTIVVQPIGIVVIGIAISLAGITFAWPLWGVHRIMTEEKERMEIECSKRYESLLNDWHSKVDNRELDGSRNLHSAIQSLIVEKDEIHKIPTWPWTPGIFRGWMASLFLPLAVWMLQWLIERLFMGG